MFRDYLPNLTETCMYHYGNVTASLFFNKHELRLSKCLHQGCPRFFKNDKVKMIDRPDGSSHICLRLKKKNKALEDQLQPAFYSTKLFKSHFNSNTVWIHPRMLFKRCHETWKSLHVDWKKWKLSWVWERGGEIKWNEWGGRTALTPNPLLTLTEALTVNCLRNRFMLSVFGQIYCCFLESSCKWNILTLIL